MAQLTSNIVWLVEQQVTLPDGNSVTALVPQAYIVDDGSRQAPSSALIAGRNLDLTVSGSTWLAAENITLNTVTESSEQNNTFSKDNWLNRSGSTETVRELSGSEAV